MPPTSVRQVVTSFVLHPQQPESYPLVLLLERSNAVRTYPNCWAGISGSINDGEKPLEAAIREIQEETGLFSHELELLQSAPPQYLHKTALLRSAHSHPMDTEVNAVSFKTDRTQPNETNQIQIAGTPKETVQFVVHPFLFQIIHSLTGFTLNWEHNSYIWVRPMEILVNKFDFRESKGFLETNAPIAPSSSKTNYKTQVPSAILNTTKSVECNIHDSPNRQNLPTVPELNAVFASVFVPSSISDLIHLIQKDRERGAIELSLLAVQTFRDWLCAHMCDSQSHEMVRSNWETYTKGEALVDIPAAIFIKWMYHSMLHLSNARPSMAPLCNAFNNIKCQLLFQYETPKPHSTVRKDQKSKDSPIFKVSTEGSSTDVHNGSTHDVMQFIVSQCTHYLSAQKDAFTKLVENVASVLCQQHIEVALIHSYSSTILASILLAHEKRSHQNFVKYPYFHIIVTESRPLFDGYKMLCKLLEELPNSEKTLKLTLITEAQIALAVQQSDIILVGADTILSDGSVINKVGTSLLALAAYNIVPSKRIPFYVCTQLCKLRDVQSSQQRHVDFCDLPNACAYSESSRGYNPELPKALSKDFELLNPSKFCLSSDFNAPKDVWLETMDAEEIMEALYTCNEKVLSSAAKEQLVNQYEIGRIDVSNVYFECTPSVYVTGGYITEKGLLTKHQLPQYVEFGFH